MRAIEGVRILCPLRNYSQVELSRTDGIALGLHLPIRESGDLRDAPPITLVGPAGSVTLPNGVIRANRHIHMSPKDAQRFGLDGARQVRVRVGGEKGLILENVSLNLGDELIPELHLDTDDANAADLTCGDNVIVEKVE
jgi:putative phosphotransacetylase